MNNQTQLPTINGASVKVMRSYDYCHFEVCLSSNDADTSEKVDELRKEAARLADKAVQQYMIAKASRERLNRISEPWRLNDAKQTPENERTPVQKAIIKYHQDEAYAARFEYDYQDDWQDDVEFDEDY